MSRPRPVLPGKTYMITRRCSQRCLFLRPSILVNHLILYLLSTACERTGVLIHAVCIMSNHLHIVLTDTRGELPEFTRWFHEFVGRCINALLRRVENVFAPGSYSRVEILTEEDMLAKIVYTLCNPVAAGLVARGKDWPGLRLGPWHSRKGKSIPRPSFFFRDNGPTAQETMLTLSKPPVFGHLSDEAYLSMVEKAVAAREDALAKEREAKGRSVLGAEQVLAQAPESQPTSPETPGGQKPRFASWNRWALIEALQRDKDWQDGYQTQRQAFKKGKRKVIFPAGTYWLVRHVGVRVASPG